MKIGVTSDTHKHLKNFARAIEYLRAHGADLIIHLGDDYADCDDVGEADVVRVPGVYSEQYQDPGIPNRKVLELGCWQVLLSHTRASHSNDLEDDLDPDSLVRCKQVDAVLYGHTHMPGVDVDRGVVFINPGHLKDDDKKGSPATYALVELDEQGVTIRIYRLKDNTLFLQEQIRR